MAGASMKHVARWGDVARFAGVAWIMGAALLTMRTPRAMRVCVVGRAGVMCALAGRGQHVPAAREGLILRRAADLLK